MNDRMILVVDDETELLEMVRSIFMRAGFTQVLTASSGEAALKICKERQPDMVILDVMILKRAYPGKDRKVFFDTATVDLEKAMVQRNGESISLTAKEFQFFEKLYENAGRIVTTGALCQAICGDFWQGYESTLATHGEFSADTQAKEMLNNFEAWAMILDDDGTVVWEENLPEELPRHYSSMDIAMFSRWYLDDYPTNIAKRQDGLLVIGMSPGGVANYYFSFKAIMKTICPYIKCRLRFVSIVNVQISTGL